VKVLALIFCFLMACSLAQGDGFGPEAPRATRSAKGRWRPAPSTVNRGFQGVAFPVTSKIFLPVGMIIRGRGRRGPYLGVYYITIF